MISGYQFWRIWHPLHLHFTSSYDIFKYNAKCRNLDKEHFSHRKDRWVFEKYASKFHGEKTAGQFILANFINNQQSWIYSSYDEANQIYLQWKSFQESLSYKFKNEYDKLVKITKDKEVTFSSLYERTPSGKKPPLLQMLIGNHIHKETVLILDHNGGNFIVLWETNFNSDPLVSDTIFSLKKYKPFLTKALNSNSIQEIISSNER